MILRAERTDNTVGTHGRTVVGVPGQPLMNSPADKAYFTVTTLLICSPQTSQNRFLLTATILGLACDL